MRIGIKMKLAAILLAVLFTITAFLGAVMVAHERSSLDGQMRAMAGTITDEFAHDTKMPLLQKDGLALNLLIKNILEYPGINGALVLNESMVVEAHGNPHEVGKAYPHAAALAKAEGKAPWLIREDDGELTFASPIVFRDTRVGYTVISFSKTFISERVWYAITSIALIAAAATVIVSVISLPMASTLLRPVFRLLKGTEEVAAGNLDYRIQEKGNDEVADLVRSFNKMAEELKKKEELRGALNRYVSPHVAEKILSGPESARLGGERREVTVFFADVRNFTSLTSRMSPEETVEILNGYFTLITDIILRFEGTVDKFIGDAVMAVFGSPVKTADHVERAVKAAVAVKRTLDTVNRIREARGLVPFTMGMGIESGAVVVGNMGSQERMEYTAVGEAVNRASRYADIARGGYVIISSTLHRAIEEHVVAEALPEMDIKGVEKGAWLYNVTDVKGAWRDDVDRCMRETAERVEGGAIAV